MSTVRGSKCEAGTLSEATAECWIGKNVIHLWGK